MFNINWSCRNLWYPLLIKPEAKATMSLDNLGQHLQWYFIITQADIKLWIVLVNMCCWKQSHPLTVLECHLRPCPSSYHLPWQPGPGPYRDTQMDQSKNIDGHTDDPAFGPAGRYLYREVMSLQVLLSCWSSQRTPAALLFWPARRTTDCSTSTLKMLMIS